jgi:phospholipid-binding lipoprotein MlaA
MKVGQTVFLVLALLLLGSAETFAAQSAVSETAVTPGEEVKPSAADQTGTEQNELEQETDDNGEDVIGEEGKGGEEEEVVQIADPLYPWNIAMYHFNDKLYFWVLKPVAKGYSSVFPEDIRIAAGNFFYNLLTPVRFVSDVLQFKMKNAGNELVRLVYNSTAGVFGLVDAAKTDFNISRHDEDLGQTFGTYGIGHGFYIVWPFIGPSSLRDTVGLVGDAFLTPVYYVTPWEASMGIEAYDRVNDTSLHIGDYEDLKEAAVDPYVAIRDAYTQHRKKKVEE